MLTWPAANAAPKYIARSATNNSPPPAPQAASVPRQPAIAAMARASMGQTDAALDALERGYEVRDPYLVLIHVSPWLDPLRGHPRFERLHARLAFPPT